MAGCALGGVAVAAGAGMLPGPFGGAGADAAAPSVSAVEERDAVATVPGDPSARGTAPGADGRPSPAAPGGPTGGAPAVRGEPDRSAPPGPGASPAPMPPGHPTGNTPDRPQEKDGKGDKPQQNGGDWAARVCREHLAAEQHGGPAPDENAVRVLERAVGIGEAGLRDYCERLLKTVGGDAAHGPAHPARPGGTGQEDGDGDGDGGTLGGLLRGVPHPGSLLGPRTPAGERTPGVTLFDPAAL
ncbi:hypothetical protein ACFP1Z_02635 [Streptomyces gamaensis]|uniref:Uncharacterized protein n=1 Tax=Streptomyces gamaensis TaxID=1763542 RepID=A0ABW0YXF5_9ACTN